MIRVVFFDIDGTLIRTGGAGVKAFSRAGHTAFGVPNGTTTMKFAGRTDTGLVREFFHLHGIAPTPEHFQRFFDSYVFWLDHLLPHCRGGVCPGIFELIQDLRQLKPAPAIALLTGNIRLGAEIKLRQYGLWELFETGAFADDHEVRDQIAVVARQRTSEMLQLTDLRGEEMLVVGDTPYDIQCGRAIGAKVLGVTTGGATSAEMRLHRPDWLVNDVREISVADLIR